MDQLWAPWRMDYIAANKGKPAAPSSACFLCDAVAADDDRAHQVVRRTDRSVVMLNKFPYNNGHLLVSPRRHVAAFEELADDELLDVQLELKRMMGVIRRRMSPHGFNVGLNIGAAAGAGLPGHLHWHLVPRWAGDANFMPATAGIRVIVQSLEALYDLLVEELAKEKP